MIAALIHLPADIISLSESSKCKSCIHHFVGFTELDEIDWHVSRSTIC